RSQFVVYVDVDMDAEEMGEDEEYEPLTEESLVERYDSDHGDEDEEAGVDMALVAAPAGLIVPDGVSLGPPRFAAVKNTAGFMRIAAAEAATTGSHHEGSREIVVLYRYTRFSRTWSGRRGVEACRRTKMHWLRFAVPPAGDMASSLAWAGASLSPLIYPGLFRRELRDLWSGLAAPAVTAAAIPPGAARLQVVVDAGILRREDHTAERMEHMRGALEDIMGEAWPEYYHVGMELNLPEPVRRREDDGGGAPPPAKRRRIVAVEEECCLCLDPLESGLAAWPGCGHVFHGGCVEETLAGRETCPLCRHKLSDALVC
uniref:RING-type domain-containing protein n=1 Tax=Setaria italica TaxID=4555 RepID=K3YND6_SETIT